MSPRNMDKSSSAIAYESLLIKRTTSVEKDIRMITEYSSNQDLESILKTYSLPPNKVIEKSMLIAKLISDMAANLPFEDDQDKSNNLEVVSRDEQIKKISKIYPNYGEDKVRRDFAIIDEYYNGASIEALRVKYRATTKDIVDVSILLAKHCSDIASAKALPINLTTQIHLIGILITAGQRSLWPMPLTNIASSKRRVSLTWPI